MKKLFILLLLVSSLYSQNNYCLQFDGGDWLQNINPYRTSDTQGSFSFWFKGTHADFQTFIDVHRDNNSANYFKIRSHTSEINVIHNDGSTDANVSADVTLTDDVWYHIVVTSDNSQYKIYIDGAEPSTYTVIGGTNNGDWMDSFINESISIAAQNNADPHTQVITGFFDEIAYFNVTLTQAQVTSIYNNGTPNDISGISGLIDYWRFEEGTGTTTTSEGSGALAFTFGDGSTGSTYPTWVDANTNGLGWDAGSDVGFDGFPSFTKFPRGD